MRTREMQPVLLLEISSFIRSTCVSWETGGDGLETASGVSRMIHLRLWMRARTKSPSNDSLFALLAIVKFDPYHDWSVETPDLGWIQPLTFSPRFHWAVTSREERREYTGNRSPLLPHPSWRHKWSVRETVLAQWYSRLTWHNMTRADTHQHRNQDSVGQYNIWWLYEYLQTNWLSPGPAHLSLSPSCHATRDAWHPVTWHVTYFVTVTQNIIRQNDVKCQENKIFVPRIRVEKKDLLLSKNRLKNAGPGRSNPSNCRKFSSPPNGPRNTIKWR